MLDEFLMGVIVGLPLGIAILGWFALIFELGFRRVEDKPLTEWRELT